jgi:GntR family transcriptional regulator, vanillate catabolism transcriptional regulator
MPIPDGGNPISRMRTKEQVLLTLRDWIVDGTLVPGETFRDAELAGALGVSRTPVRGAIAELEHEGLARREETGRIVIAPIAVSDLEKIVPVRVELEALAARLAAEHGRECLPAIEEANERLRSVSDGAGLSDTARATTIREANDAFHATILAASDNPYLRDYVTAMRALHQRYENLYFTNPLPLGMRSADEHERVIAAIRAADPAAAADAMRDHLYRASHDLIERLRSGETGMPVAV